MRYGALSTEAVIFANHPVATSDQSDTRPGYWYGNGVMPAVRQEKGILGAVYQIPKEHPIHFTHVYWPGVKFDQNKVEDHWLFGKKGNGYIGMWCSKKLKLYQDQVFNCEYRSYGDEIAYCVFCGDQKEYNTMEAFIENCKKRTPVYADGELRTGAFEVMYKKYRDETQYI